MINLIKSINNMVRATAKTWQQVSTQDVLHAKVLFTTQPILTKWVGLGEVKK
jgi:hypothetical protein